MITFTLPLPSSALCANNSRHGHWGGRSKPTREARAFACLVATQARIKYGKPVTEVKHLKVTYDRSCTMVGRKKLPVGYRPHDKDNAISALKAYQDGIADGLGVNDRDFGGFSFEWGFSGTAGVTFEVVVK